MTIVDDNMNEVLRKAAQVIDPTTYSLRTGTGMVPSEYDEVTVTYPDSVTEVYAFKRETVTITTITITYTSSTKENLLSAVKS